MTLVRRDPERPGHVSESANEVETGYMFLPASSGNGYATEAVAAVPLWAETYLPSAPIVLCTQAAHEASVRLVARLGFRAVEWFVESLSGGSGYATKQRACWIARRSASRCISRNRGRHRLQVMTPSLNDTAPRSASLTTPQLETVQRLWHIAGLAPTSGYGTAALAATVASNYALADTLTSVDFNDFGSVANAVEALLQWRECMRK